MIISLLIFVNIWNKLSRSSRIRLLISCQNWRCVHTLYKLCSVQSKVYIISMVKDVQWGSGTSLLRWRVSITDQSRY